MIKIEGKGEVNSWRLELSKTENTRNIIEENIDSADQKNSTCPRFY